ncbi:unnamed protein product [Urochloa humidicola]
MEDGAARVRLGGWRRRRSQGREGGAAQGGRRARRRRFHRTAARALSSFASLYGAVVPPLHQDATRDRSSPAHRHRRSDLVDKLEIHRYPPHEKQGQWSAGIHAWKRGRDGAHLFLRAPLRRGMGWPPFPTPTL